MDLKYERELGPSRIWIEVDGEPVYTMLLIWPEPGDRLYGWQDHWVLEVDGTLVIDGQLMNLDWGYGEIFNWLLLERKAFSSMSRAVRWAFPTMGRNCRWLTMRSSMGSAAVATKTRAAASTWSRFMPAGRGCGTTWRLGSMMSEGQGAGKPDR